jgi:hypothetical protein
LRIPQHNRDAKRDKLALSNANERRDGGRPENKQRDQNESEFRECEHG